MTKSFQSELEMSNTFSNLIDRLKSSDNITLLPEQKGLFGVPDFILVEDRLPDDKLIISIELKLKNWNQAIKQAYRYKSFSHYSFVVLDELNIKPAINNLNLFKDFNIGLASLNPQKELKIVHYPNFEIPFNSILVDKIYSILPAREQTKISFPSSDSRLNKEVLIPVRF